MIHLHAVNFARVDMSSLEGGFGLARELKLLRKAAKSINTKKKALNFLASTGMYTKTGRLKKQFR